MRRRRDACVHTDRDLGKLVPHASAERADCEAHATAQGYTFATVDLWQFPSGCWRTTGASELYWNTHWADNNHPSASRVCCDTSRRRLSEGATDPITVEGCSVASTGTGTYKACQCVVPPAAGAEVVEMEAVMKVARA